MLRMMLPALGQVWRCALLAVACATAAPVLGAQPAAPNGFENALAETTCDTCGPTCGQPGCCSVDPCDPGIIYPSESCFPSFTAPVTNSVLFSDPRTLTSIRFFFINQNIPSSSALGGGDAQVVAAQLRVALSERLSIVAAKDGWINLNPAVDALEGNGAANLAAGLQYNLIRDVENQFLLTGGFTYEVPMGSSNVFQGNGDGDFHFYLSSGIKLTDCVNWISGSGFRIPVDNGSGTQLWYWSNHFDVELITTEKARVYAFCEFNWYHWMSSGNGDLASGFEGGDLLNLGAADVAGNDIVTVGFGPAFKLSDWLEMAVAWEVPLTDRRDLMQDRLTVQGILKY